MEQYPSQLPRAQSVVFKCLVLYNQKIFSLLWLWKETNPLILEAETKEWMNFATLALKNDKKTIKDYYQIVDYYFFVHNMSFD